MTVKRPAKAIAKRKRGTRTKTKVPAKAALKIRPDVQNAGGITSLPVIQRPTKAAKPQREHERGIVKRKRENLDEVDPDNDIRSRLRPRRRRICYKG